MKTLRRILIVLAAPAAILMGLNQLGGTPLSKGYETGFSTTVEGSPEPRLAVETDAGNLSCWVRLRVPSNSAVFTAKLSTGSPLWVYQDKDEGSAQWIAIVADGQKIQEQFKWPAGATLQVSSGDKTAASLAPSDWQLFLSDKGYDSKQRASWRKTLFRFSLLFLSLAIVGGILETHARLKEVSPVLTAQRCIDELIKATEGPSTGETKWMQTILTKVLLEGVAVADALDLLPLEDFQKRVLWFKTRNQFRSRLERLIVDLNTDLSYLHP